MFGLLLWIKEEMESKYNLSGHIIDRLDFKKKAIVSQTDHYALACGHCRCVVVTELAIIWINSILVQLLNYKWKLSIMVKLSTKNCLASGR